MTICNRNFSNIFSNPENVTRNYLYIYIFKPLYRENGIKIKPYFKSFDSEKNVDGHD